MRVLAALCAVLAVAAVCAAASAAAAPHSERASPANGLECDICTFVVQELQSLADQNSTVTEILQALDKACALLPAQYSQECTDVVDNYGPQLIQYLDGLISPSAVCDAIGLCSNSSAGAAAARPTTKPAKEALLRSAKGALVCEICEFVAGELEHFVTQNSTEQEIVAAVEKVCQFVPAKLSDLCDAYVEIYGPELIAALVAKETPQVLCTQLHACASRAPVAAESGMECAACKFVLGEVEKFITSASTEQEIVNLVDNVCKIVPASFRSVCQAFIAEYGPLLIQKLIDREDPITLCSQIGLCSSSLGASVSMAPATNGLECTICEWVLGEIEGLLTNNSTEQEIITAVAKVCNIVPSSFRSVCQAFIEEYGPEVIQMLVNKESPDAVCTQLGLCTSKAVAAAPAPVETAANGLECTICEWVLGEIEGLLTNNSTEQEIVAAVEKVCNIVPSSFRSVCQAFIEEYGPEVIQMLVNKESPDAVCTQIGLCKTAVAAAPVETAANGLECTICEWVLGEIEGLLTNNSTEQEIVAAVEKVCNIVPSSFRSVCQAFIEEYGPEVIQMLVNKESPSTICTQLGLCTSAAQASGANGIECALCQWVMSELESLIGNNATEQHIVASVEKVCSVLPAAYRGACDSLIEAYGPYMINLLIQKESPSVVCAQVHLCASTAAPAAPAPTPVPAPAKAVNGLECTVCQWAATELENLLSANATEEDIIVALQKVCSMLPKSLESACDDFVGTYTPELIELLLQSESPTAICQQLGLCTQSAKLDATADAVLRGSLLCPACEFVMATVENFVTENTTEAEIVTLLSKVCDMIPGALKSECVGLLDLYGAKFIEELVARESPAVICTKLSLCKSAAALRKAALPTGAKACRVCEWLVGEAEQYIEQPAEEEAIAAKLAELCKVLPGTAGDLCQSLIDSLGGDLIAMLLGKETPDKICTQLHVCDAVSNVQLLAVNA